MKDEKNKVSSIQKVNGRYVDSNNNNWDANQYTLKQCKTLSKTLINCNDCRDCSNCSNCRGCNDCSYCNHCNYCIDCRDCNDCSKCNDCSNCNYCSYCSNCRGCRDCSCCNYCNDCNDCSYCAGFTSNPARIYSKLIGSRKSYTHVYIGENKIQVNCGCFQGDLNEFKAHVQKTHANNEQYLKEYLDFINFVENYMSYLQLDK